MKLYIDGDALPNLIKPLLFRAIERVQLETIVISNAVVNMGQSKLISYIVVEAGPDIADKKIIELAQRGDLVITADIPLADHAITKGCHVIGHRGEDINPSNIKNMLAMRDLKEQIRDEGGNTSGPASYSQKDYQKFANQLSKTITMLGLD